MYSVSPALSILYITMGILSKQLNSLRFGRGKPSSIGELRSEKIEKQNYVGPYDNSKIPRVTIHSFIMGIFVSMGGFIFGYDTGQISGFLGMANFQKQFGQKNANGDGGYHFSNVRSGLIVALLSVGTLMGALIAGFVADRIGRKWSISAWCLMLHLGLIVQISASDHKWYQSKSFPKDVNRLTHHDSCCRTLDCWPGSWGTVSFSPSTLHSHPSFSESRTEIYDTFYPLRCDSRVPNI